MSEPGLEECARLIALEHHKDAQRGYELRGLLSSGARVEIERQVNSFEHAASKKGARPSINDMVAATLRANNSGDFETRDIIADLYVLGNNGAEYYFEMKSPKPNKDQCLRITQRILQTHALRNRTRPGVMSYMAMAYNPYGNSREDYRWSIAKNYLPYEEAVLIGDEFWNIIGGPSAYDELLEIYHFVGRAKRKYIVDALAFGF